MRKGRHLRNVIALSALAATSFAVTDGLAQAESKTVEQEVNVIEETVLENDVEFALEVIDVELVHEVEEGEGTELVLESDQDEQLVLDEEAEVDFPVVDEEESDTEDSTEEVPTEDEEQPVEEVPHVDEEQPVEEVPHVDEEQPVEEAPVVDDEVEAGTPIDQDQTKPKPPFDGEWEFVEVEYGFWIPTGPVPTEFTEADAEKWIAYLDSLSEEEIWMWLDHISDEWLNYIVDLIWWYLDDEWWIEIPEEECNEGGAVTPPTPTTPVEKSPVKEVTQVKHVEKEAGPVLKKSSDTSKASTSGEKLPDTSTSMYNVGFAGLLALLAGVAMRFRRKSTPES
ncbi:hypothetical protein DH09_15710 [Bacillaceae bacterium JMAK1]|nr:hypothetical protein DH09_15710 [Bacillaceae bacterium JMAK1]